MKITIFTTTTCPYCKMLKTYLGEKNIQFIEKLVDKDDMAKTEMEAKSNGYLGVPFVLIEKDDGSEETVIGFNKAKLSGILNI